MRKLGLLVAVLVIIIAGYMYVNKTYYPALPIENVSAKDVIGKLGESDDKIVRIAKKNDGIWYATTSDLKTDDRIKQLIVSKGWEFKQKEGSGLFFEKDGARLIATTQMWTSKYVLIQIQSEFDEL